MAQSASWAARMQGLLVGGCSVLSILSYKKHSTIVLGPTSDLLHISGSNSDGSEIQNNPDKSGKMPEKKSAYFLPAGFGVILVVTIMARYGKLRNRCDICPYPDQPRGNRKSIRCLGRLLGARCAWPDESWFSTRSWQINCSAQCSGIGQAEQDEAQTSKKGEPLELPLRFYYHYVIFSQTSTIDTCWQWSWGGVDCTLDLRTWLQPTKPDLLECSDLRGETCWGVETPSCRMLMKPIKQPFKPALKLCIYIYFFKKKKTSSCPPDLSSGETAELCAFKNFVANLHAYKRSSPQSEREGMRRKDEFSLTRTLRSIYLTI